ncbi:response regulator [Rhizobium skierniewicense]|uniref:response regulator n=1 Tax=Rhizobium skierniewicense TaxID=984260 RepID=UPI0015730B79|nr:response regulator [Rhizobium skierniewicense]NTF34541.1 response regulator [Rhizobium skierniewicense]
MPLALEGRQYLVVEDEYLVASHLLMTLEDAGARVFGPISDVKRAIEVLSDPDFPVDAAILDINLGGELVYPAAELLAHHGKPFVFVTGSNITAMPAEFQHVPRLMKPYDTEELITTLQQVAG